MRAARSPYGRTVLVTGGSSGIGLATARRLAGAGFEVYAASRTADPAAPAERVAGGGRVHQVVLDVTSEASVDAAVRAVAAEAGPIGIVVHCAGMGIAGAAADTPDAAAHAQLETNYFGVLRVNSAVLPSMLAAGRGLVVIVSSVAALFPVPFQSHYSSSKAALESYGRALAMEARRHGVRVALVQPGDTKTGFTAAREFHIGEASVFAETARRSVARMERDEQRGRSPDTVARRVVRLTGLKHPPVRNVIGWDYAALVWLARLLPVRTVDWLLGKLYVPGP